MDAREFIDRGVEQLRSSQWKEAIGSFTEAIRLRPEAPSAYRLRAKAWADSGNPVRAVSDLDEAVRIAKDDADLYFDRATILMRQKMYEPAVADCNRGLALDPARADLLALRGRIHAANGRSGQARLDLGRAIETDPDGCADYYIWRGDLSLELEDNCEALQDYDRALELQPTDPYALSQRARAWWAERDLDRALTDFTAAISHDPEWCSLWSGRGLVRLDRGEYALAIPDLSRAIELDPKTAIAWEYRGDCHDKLGDFAKAKADFDEAIRLHPGIPRTWNRRAVFHYYNHDYSASLRDHMEALKKDPDDAGTLNYLAWVWCTAPNPTVRNGRRALECATRSNELSEWQSGSFLDTLAAACAEMGQWDNALKWARKAVAIVEDERAKRDFDTRISLYEDRRPLRHTPTRPTLALNPPNDPESAM